MHPAFTASELALVGLWCEDAMEATRDGAAEAEAALKWDEAVVCVETLTLCHDIKRKVMTCTPGQGFQG